jgi:hypothetical protein
MFKYLWEALDWAQETVQGRCTVLVRRPDCVEAVEVVPDRGGVGYSCVGFWDGEVINS